MVEPYYNLSYGTGFEGFINYANVIVDGWLVNAFLILIFSLSMFVLSKSEWKMSGILSFSFFPPICIPLLRHRQNAPCLCPGQNHYLF